MALLLVTPVRCPYTGDAIAPTAAQVQEIQDNSTGKNAVVEIVCPTCGANGRLERRQELEVPPNALALLQAGTQVQIKNNDHMRLTWALDNLSVVKTLTPS